MPHSPRMLCEALPDSLTVVLHLVNVVARPSRDRKSRQDVVRSNLLAR